MRTLALCVLALMGCEPPDAQGVVSATRSDGFTAQAVESTSCLLSIRASHYRPNGLVLDAVLPLPEGGSGHLKIDVRTPQSGTITRGQYDEDSGFRSTQVSGSVTLSGAMSGSFGLTFLSGSQQRLLTGTFRAIAVISDSDDDSAIDDGDDIIDDPGDDSGDDSGGDDSGDDGGDDSGSDDPGHLLHRVVHQNMG
jgi:hypothetical protein